MKKIDIHLHAALDPVPGTEKFKISTGEEMLAHLEELQIEKAVVMSSERQKEQWLLSPETRNAENWPEDFLKNMYGCVIWMKIVKKPLKRGSGNIKGREL